MLVDTKSNEQTWIDHIKSVYSSSQLQGDVFYNILTLDDDGYYEISCAEELALVAYYSNEVAAGRVGDSAGQVFMEYSACFMQVNDIDLSGYIWVGINANANGSSWFYEYYGGTYAISNLTSKTGGLFSRLSSNGDDVYLYNITLKNAVIDSGSGQYNGVGGLVDYVRDVSYSEIEDCNIEAYIKVNPHCSAGGVIGFVSGKDSTVNCWDCYFSGTITVDETSNQYGIGGIVGSAGDGNEWAPNYLVIEGGVFNGEILGSKTDTVGGILGYTSWLNDEMDRISITINSCMAKGLLRGGRVGGIIGHSHLNGFDDYFETNQFLSIYDCAVFAVLDILQSSQNLFCGHFDDDPWCAQTEFYNCSFVGTVLGSYEHTISLTGDDESQNHELINSYCNYVCFNGIKERQSSSSWTGFRIVPNINDGLPMQTALYYIASVAPQQDIAQWFNNNGFEQVWV